LRGAHLFSAGAGSFAKALPEATAPAWRIFCNGKKAKTVTEKRDPRTSRPAPLFAMMQKIGQARTGRGCRRGTARGEVGQRNGCALFAGVAQKVPKPGIKIDLFRSSPG